LSEQAIDYLKENRDELLEKLNEFLSIPSISTDSTYKQDVEKAADFLVTYLQELSFEKVTKQEIAGHPLVYAEYNGAGEDAPTVLFYGHYDV